tara:strand:+ start:3260 stop:4366 length:1107 start_codon:yes stop_codon:yes gene_type:complete
MQIEKKQSLFSKLNEFVISRSSIPFIQKVFFVSHLRTMIGAGISLVESLTIIQKEVENARLNQTITQIKEDIEQGQTLSKTLEKHKELFPSAYVKMIEAGELSGNLQQSLEQVETQMKKTQSLVSSIRSAMIYPSVIVSAMLVVGLIMVVVVLPKITIMFEEFNTELPLATRVLIGITNYLSDPFFLTVFLVLLFSSIICHIVLLKKVSGYKLAVHSITIRLPIFGKIIKKINLSRFSFTLSSLLKSAIPIVDAIHITANTCSNAVYKKALHTTATEVEKGTPLSIELSKHSRIFPATVTGMLYVGEKSGEIDALLHELSKFYTEEVDKTMKNFATIIEPLVILILGLGVAGIAVAVVSPMYSLIQNF